jgi:hypothetical protein
MKRMKKKKRKKRKIITITTKIFPPQNTETTTQNLYNHTVDFVAMWFMFFCLWGTTVAIYSNVYSIFYSLQDPEKNFGFSSARNAVLSSCFGVGNSAGRALAGLSIPLIQGRAQPVYSLLRISPLFMIFGLMFFLVTKGIGLAIPFVITGVATGFTWGSTIVFSKKIFANPASAYAFFYTAGIAGIAVFNIGMFSAVYSNAADKQQNQQQQQNFNNNTNGHNNNNNFFFSFDENEENHNNFTTTTTTISPTTSSSERKHYLGLECIELSIWISILANVIAVICAEFVIYRIDRGNVDTVLTTKLSSILMGKTNQIVEEVEEKIRASAYAFQDSRNSSPNHRNNNNNNRRSNNYLSNEEDHDDANESYNHHTNEASITLTAAAAGVTPRAAVGEIDVFTPVADRHEM